MAVLGPQSGSIPFTLVSAANNNATLVKAAPGHLTIFSGGNVNANPRYVKFFDTAIASTSGFSGINPVWNIILPGNTAGAGSNVPLSAAGPQVGGLQFFNGIAFMITPNIALTDQSGVSAGDVTINLGYV